MREDSPYFSNIHNKESWKGEIQKPNRTVETFTKIGKEYGIIEGELGESCDKVCEKINKKCDPSFLTIIDRSYYVNIFEDKTICGDGVQDITYSDSSLMVFPARLKNTHECHFQRCFCDLNCYAFHQDYHRHCLCL